MYPVISNRFNLLSYPVIFLLGYFTAYLLARMRSKKYRVEGRHIDNLAIILIITGLAGATFFGRFFYSTQKHDLWFALNIFDGGPKVLYGGIVLGIVAVTIYSFVMRVEITKLGDILAPSLAIGIVFGRIGCFCAGCCWGGVIDSRNQLQVVSDPILISQLQSPPFMSSAGFPFSVTYPKGSHAYKQHIELGLIKESNNRSLPVHPVPIYEAVFCFILFIFLFMISHKNTGGMLFLIFIMCYSSIRFFLEFFRATNPPVYFGMTISQVISLIAMSVCFSGLIIRSRLRLSHVDK